MSASVFCLKLQQTLPPLDEQPFPGRLGKFIHQNISAQAWDDWLEQQTMIINENRLSLLDPSAMTQLEQHMRAYLRLDEAQNNNGSC